ncbi:NAD(P)-binding protein [Cucurbitaria berberidis CBS 394.84]|uniref:NAD(P)-binding protein n=1 Tax=Cucurbitaria berberidis CBS 394.84 TaxID=1168544 RepID=A0A9P4GL18_9PLEO|nr:NAD(P)-binding protein [Cucurbitaria berberidis CBS 394.84]KAF1847015.1 NAD(P)-binding protein [Cucurbitaria berberidis CBS 394.84]
MSYPNTYRAWRRTIPPYPLQIVSSNETLPEQLGELDVLIRIHAVSLNYRDVGMLRENGYPVPVEAGGISASDCAAEVVAIGSAVRGFVIGDHVAPTVDLLNLTGDERTMEQIALGGDGPGTLREYAVFEEKVLVKLPKHLSWEEASIVPSVGITSWVTLDSLKNLKKDTTILLQGTGGVSMFTLLIALATGIKPIITSSSDAKLEKVKQLGNVQGINYKTHPDVAAEVLRLTGGKGVDYVVNNAGLASIPSDLQMLRKNGSVVLVGFLGGFDASFSPSTLMTLMLKAAKLQGILGGSKVDFEMLVEFLEAKKIHVDTIIDRVFSFDDAPAAFEYLSSGKHVGKVVIRL